MIRVAIVGYGNLGKACERIAVRSDKFKPVGIFTRRDKSAIVSPFGTPVYSQDELENFKDETDVVCICTGSANDVTGLGVRLAANFNTVDSFDTHAKMAEYANNMSSVASENGRLSFIGIGWDPGLFSLMRALFEGVLNDGITHTFWGRGVSQGHSEAIRRLDGVEDAKQYTIPKEDALKLARSGEATALSDRDKHLRECYVVAKEGADKAEIERKIVTMPNYFEPYDTNVYFIGKEEFDKNHSAMPHAGIVMRSGETNDCRHNLEFSLRLDSNPDFTASVLMAYAAANARMYANGERGVKTVLDIPISELLDGDLIDNIKRFV